jgi:hypothetical protein
MDNDIIKNGFGKILNTHGYGFHYSVLKLAHTLSDNNESHWIFEAAEFPVQVQSEGTRIDFILRLNDSTPIFLLAECKRANPAFSNWCFAKVPYIHRNRSSYEPLLIECLRQDNNDVLSSSAYEGSSLDNACHIAIEVKSDEKGEPNTVGRGRIEESVTQICRGLNGFVEFIGVNKQIFSNKKTLFLLPVIFTTAKIWESNVELSLTEIEKGNVNLDNTKLNEKPWIFYQYHLSPGIKHSHSPTERSNQLGKLLDSEYIRTIAIVSAAGITEFLKWSSHSFNYLD